MLLLLATAAAHYYDKTNKTKENKKKKSNIHKFLFIIHPSIYHLFIQKEAIPGNVPKNIHTHSYSISMFQMVDDDDDNNEQDGHEIGLFDSIRYVNVRNCTHTHTHPKSSYVTNLINVSKKKINFLFYLTISSQFGSNE